MKFPIGYTGTSAVSGGRTELTLESGTDIQKYRNYRSVGYRCRGRTEIYKSIGYRHSLRKYPRYTLVRTYPTEHSLVIFFTTYCMWRGEREKSGEALIPTTSIQRAWSNCCIYLYIRTSTYKRQTRRRERPALNP